MKFSPLAVFLAASLAASAALADDVEKNILTVATSHETAVAYVAREPLKVVYVGEVEGCSAVGVQREGNLIENYRVCKGKITPRMSIPRSWPYDEVNKKLLASVINDTMLNGRAEQTDQKGYLVAADAVGDLKQVCKNIEIKVSYKGDLVDYTLRRECGKPKVAAKPRS